MRPTFGIHRGKDVERLDEDEQRSLLAWLEERIDEGDDGPKMPEFKRLALTLRKSLAAIDEANDEVRAEEDRADDPLTNLARMPDRQVRLLLALMELRDQTGLDPFPASGDRLAELSGLSKPSISTAIAELVRDGFILNPTRGEFRIVGAQSKETLLSRFSSSLFFSISTSRKEEKKSESKVTYTSRTEAIMRGFEILKAQPDDIVLRYARQKLARLMRQGVTYEDYIAAVTWARKEYDESPRPFLPLLDLVYILDPARFRALVTASKTTKAKPQGRAIAQLLEPEAHDAWAADRLRKLKERGIG